MFNKSVAIIGAGLSAAVCAKALNGLVDKISVFEQDSRVGGRLCWNEHLSTTPSFTVSTPFFQQIVDRWIMDGLVTERQAWNVEILDTEMHTLSNDQPDYVVLPNTIALVQNLFTDIPVELNTEVTEMEIRDNKWRLFDFDGTYLGQFDSVIFSSAVPSLYELVKPSKNLLTQFKKLEFSSVWSVVLTLKDDVKDPYDSALFLDSALASSFYTDDNQLVLNATPEWSEKYSALPHEQVAEALRTVYCEHTQTNVDRIVSATAKFWPNKAPINTLGQDCLFDESLGLGACGDWCTSPRVEGAVLSGFSIADRVMKHFSSSIGA